MRFSSLIDWEDREISLDNTIIGRLPSFDAILIIFIYLLDLTKTLTTSLLKGALAAESMVLLGLLCECK